MYPSCIIDSHETYQYYNYDGKKIGCVKFSWDLNHIKNHLTHARKEGSKRWIKCGNGAIAQRIIGAI